MWLASPTWLLLLAPWLGLVILCLREFRPRIYVSFLRLWPREDVQSSSQRFWRRPPLSLVLLLLSLLLSIFALADPRFPLSAPTLRRLTIIVDRGVTMLAGGRLQSAADQFVAASQNLLSAETVITLRDGSSIQTAAPSHLRADLTSGVTAFDETQTIRLLATAQSDEPVVVLSDLLDLPAILCPPVGVPRNVGIVSASAGQGRLLLTLRNDSDRKSVDVQVVGAGGRKGSHSLDLPARGLHQTYTIESLAACRRVDLLISDDLPDDNVHWLVPAASARLLASASLPDRVQRFASAYSQARREVEPSAQLKLAVFPELPERDAIIVAAASERRTLEATHSPDHPVLAGVKLPAAVLASTDVPARRGWRTVLSAGNHVLLAIDEENRRAYIGYQPADESNVPDWLVLLTNLADHLARPRLSVASPRRLEPSWRPIEVAPADAVAGTRAGLYRRGGETIAINVAAPVLRECRPADIQSQLMAYATRQSERHLSPWIWVAASGLTVAAGVSLWWTSRQSLAVGTK